MSIEETKSKKDILILTNVIKLVARRRFTEFNFLDWQIFPNCQTKNPLISYGNKEGDFIIILDGDTIVLTKHSGGKEYEYRIY